VAFSFTKNNAENVAGDMRITSGTFTSAGGSTGGDIYTGLQKVNGMILQQNAAAVVASQAVINETFPKADPITIVSAANAVGYWQAWGW
jgi:hypothetical protein